MFETFRRSLDKAGKYWNQPAIVDHISPKRWVVGIRRFVKSPLRVSSLVFAKNILLQDLHIHSWDFCFIKN
jgi:hypothetical protein